jgi:hypothetical protein
MRRRCHIRNQNFKTIRHAMSGGRCTSLSLGMLSPLVFWPTLSRASSRPSLPGQAGVHIVLDCEPTPSSPCEYTNELAATPNQANVKRHILSQIMPTRPQLGFPILRFFRWGPFAWYVALDLSLGISPLQPFAWDPSLVTFGFGSAALELSPGQKHAA